jgi:drug efflux transport system permease protein
MVLWLRQVLALAQKELLTILKDPRSRFVVIGPPIIQFFVFGYAATFDVTNVAYAVVDEDHSPESRDLLSRFEGSRNFSIVGDLGSVQAIRRSIDSMDARLVLHVGPQFAERLHRGQSADLQVILDGRNSNVSGIALTYIEGIVQQWNAEHALAGGPSIRVVSRAWFNPNLESRWFIVSALPVQLALIVVLLITSLSIAREREQGTFDQTLVAPLGSVQILAGKSVPAFVLGMLDGLLLSAGSVAWFGIPMTGSLTALCAVLSVYIVAILGVGLFISSLAATMQQALLGGFMFIMPAVILSGFTTPIENMPHWLQAATVANPARYAVAGCRAVFLEGARVVDIGRYLLPMAVVAVVCLSAAGWLFRFRTR